MGERSIYQVLAKVQHSLSVPKGRVNKFGGYSYRSLEDINAALKPICEENGCGYIFTDEIIPKRADDGSNPSWEKTTGSDSYRWYLRAKVTFFAEGCNQVAEATAYAREPMSKKGMDDAQVTGLASSYARKYAACALFAIDSGEEVDAMDNGNTGRKNKGGTPTPDAPKKAVKTDSTSSEKASDDQLVAVAGKVSEYAQMCDRSVQDVWDALEKSKTMVKAGYGHGEMTAMQADLAVQLVDSWIIKTRGKDGY